MNFARRQAGHRAGFTLTELLAVIAIIGVIAAILIPLAGSARSRAKSAVCTGNLRQCGLVLRQYAQENKQIIPTRWSQSGKWYGWNASLHQQGYLQMNTKAGTRMGERIYSCSLGYDDVINYNDVDPQAYGINLTAWTKDGVLAGVNTGAKTYVDSAGKTYTQQSLLLSEIPRPGSFVLLADSFNKWDYQNSGGREVQKSIFGEASSTLWMRHHGGQNVLLADGHVERITPADMGRFLRENIPGGYWK